MELEDSTVLDLVSDPGFTKLDETRLTDVLSHLEAPKVQPYPWITAQQPRLDLETHNPPQTLLAYARNHGDLAMWQQMDTRGLLAFKDD